MRPTCLLRRCRSPRRGTSSLCHDHWTLWRAVRAEAERRGVARHAWTEFEAAARRTDEELLAPARYARR